MLHRRISTQGGTLDVSAAGGGMAVSANTGVFNVSAQGGAISVSANTGNISVSARNTVDVSAQGGVITVSARAGTVDVSAQGGAVATSVRNVADVSAAGGNISVSARNVVDVSAAGGNISVSARNTVDVSAQAGVMTVSARAANASVAGRVTTYFALPASHITDGAQTETRTLVNVSGASAGTYKLVSAAVSGVLRISRMLLTFGSAARVTFRQTSVAASSIDFTGPMFLDDRGAVVLDRSDSPWFVTTGTKDFSVNVSAGVGIAGVIWHY